MLSRSEQVSAPPRNPDDGPPVLRVRDLSKRYTRDLRRSLGYALHDIGRELVPRGRRPEPRPGEFYALEGVSFELRPGEALAVLGANGAGKSTLLKVLHGLVKPDRGEARVGGRVGALIELGTGFEPVLSGRENIALAAAVVGLSDREARAATEQIVEFAELEGQIDTPVRYYSSGMVARLAFAVAAHLRPDLLLVDEVLAVGDFAFQRKCVAHMRRYIADGGALILVSHNVFLAQTVCERGMVLEHGRCSFAGDVAEAVGRYLTALHAERESLPGAAPAGDASEPVVVEDLVVTAADGEAPRTGAPARVTLTYRCREPVGVHWGFSIWTGDHWVCVTGAVNMYPREIAGRGTLSCTVPDLPLLGGTYAARGYLADVESKQPLALFGYDDGRPPRAFTVESDRDLLHNALIATTQLVTLDVEWDQLA
jgi:homopolymeric O-antigen transport system ATP-binding protein